MRIPEERSSSANEGAWTFEVPFQYAWVKAVAEETELEPESARDFIVGAFPSISRVRIDRAAPDAADDIARVHAWQLRAPCPFCEAANNQLLRSEGWISVREWDEHEEIDLQKGGWLRSASRIGYKVMHELGIGNVLNWKFFSKAMRAWSESALLKDGIVSEEKEPSEPETACSASKPHVNAYGVSLPEVLATLAGARSTAIDSCEDDLEDRAVETIAWEFGVEGYFGGLHRCAHCGNHFAVVFRDPYDDTKEGRYRISPDIVEKMESFISDTSRFLAASGGSRANMPTMAFEVGRKGNLVTASTNIAGTPHELAFDTESGSFTLDGDSYVSGGLPSRLDLYELYSHPLTQDLLPVVPQVSLKMLEMLPPLPEDFDVPLGRLSERGYAINLLISVNRFLGYPASFYEEMALSESIEASTCGLRLTYPFEAGLSRDCFEVEALYRQAGLLENQQLAQVLHERPQVLLYIRRMKEIPFTNPDVLACFFRLPRLEYCLRTMCRYPNSAKGWKRLAKVKGDDAVLAYIEEQAKRPNIISSLPEDEKFWEATRLLDVLCGQVTDEQLAGIRTDALYEDLKELASCCGAFA